MKHTYALLILLTCLIGVIPAGAQEYDDDEPVKALPGFFAYYPISKVAAQGNNYALEVEMGTDLEDWYDVKNGKKIPALVAGDEVVVLPVYGATSVRCEESRMKLVSLRMRGDKDRHIPVRFIVNAATADCKPQAGDLLAVKLRQDRKAGLLIPLLIDNNIVLLDNSRQPILDKDSRVYELSQEMPYIASLYRELKTNAVYFRESGFTKPMTDKGPAAGKSAPDILEAATVTDVIDLLNFVASYPRKYMGRPFKFVEIYATWVINSKPAGTVKGLQLYGKADVIAKAKLLYADLEKGTVGGLAVISSPEEVLSNFPFFTGHRTGADACHEYYDWGMGNSMTYSPADRSFSYTGTHTYSSGAKLMEADSATILNLYGKPDMRLMDSRLFYRYRRSWGTLEFNFNTEIGKPIVTIITLYGKQPDAISCK